MGGNAPYRKLQLKGSGFFIAWRNRVGLDQIQQILGIIGIVIGAASAIAAATPTPKDDVIIGKVYKIIDLLALNVGKAKDK